MSLSTTSTSMTIFFLCNVMLFTTTVGYSLIKGQDEHISRHKKFILTSSSKQSWTTLEQFSACALTCVPGFEKLTQVCCDTGLDAVCSNLPWTLLKDKLGTCVDLTSTGIATKAWTSLEQFAACFLSCVAGFEKLTEVCCQTGLDAVCSNLPWDSLKPKLGVCQGTSMTAPQMMSTTTAAPSTSQSTSPSTQLPQWTHWGGWTCKMSSNKQCIQVRYRSCSTNVCPGTRYELQICNQADCPDMFTTKSTTTSTTTTTPSQAVTSPTGTCEDDPNAPGCKDKDIIVEICKDAQIAKTVCPKSCGLCGQVNSTVQTTSVNKYSSGSPTTDATAGTCHDDEASGACRDPAVLAALCNDNSYAWRYCPKSCNKCDTCWDYLECSDPSAQSLFCGREDMAIQYCRKTCGKCDHKPVPVTVNTCGDPVANELICEVLQTEICICSDLPVRSLCANFCDDKCSSKASSLPACKPVTDTSNRRRRDELLQQYLLN